MKFNHILSGLALSAAVLAAGCQKSLEYSDVVYFTGTENSNITNMYVDGPSSMGVTVTSSCKMAADVQVSLAVDAAAVDAYNALHGTDYRMLPAGSYRLSDEAVTIAEGTNVSTPSSFEIVSMDDFDEGANYCVPLKITGTSNGMGVLEASRTQYIFISQITTTRGINLKNSWYITMDGMVDDPALKDLPACTMEIRMYANGWRTSGHMISSLIGVEENFLLRVGDESIKSRAAAARRTRNLHHGSERPESGTLVPHRRGGQRLRNDDLHRRQRRNQRRLVKQQGHQSRILL